MADTVITISEYSFSETMTRLTQAIISVGNTLFADIDQSVAAQSVGLTLRPTRLLIYGNPKGGTPLMEAFPLVALDLPLKFLVWEEHGTVSIAYSKITALADRYGVTGKDAQIAAMARAVEAIVASAQ